MNENNNSILILEEMMKRTRRFALEKDVSVYDVVHEALDRFLYSHETGINFADILGGIETGMSEPEYFVTSVDLYGYTVIVKSPIRYIHRPELKYKIVITQNDSVSAGKMCVTLRSHDINTLRRFSEFLNLWITLETNHIQFGGQIKYITDAGYFERKVYIPVSPQRISGQIIGAAISDYIHVFDELLKYFFNHPNDIYEIEKIYRDRVKNGKLKI